MASKDITIALLEVDLSIHKILGVSKQVWYNILQMVLYINAIFRDMVTTTFI